ncbi:hypothetical protein [Haloferax namakaokahaiae]|uniref:hypothetical protein n=1 Tax=Haloferax namakaokahaiae TaxID=1748331 RepID=UPI0036F1C664
MLFVVLGVAFATVPTGSFSSMAGERAVSVDVAGPGDDSLIDMRGTGEVATPRPDFLPFLVFFSSPEAMVVNNIGSPTTVTYQVSIDEGLSAYPRWRYQSSGQSEISEGSPLEIYAWCGDTTGSGIANLTVEISDAQAGNLTIQTATLTTRIPYDC